MSWKAIFTVSSNKLGKKVGIVKHGDYQHKLRIKEVSRLL